MRKKIKSCMCVLLSVLIAVFSFNGVSANAEITFEQEVMIFLNDKGYEQGVPYLPSYFQNLYNWSNCKSAWETFCSIESPNLFYYTSVYNPTSSKFLTIVKYDYIVSTADVSNVYRVYFNQAYYFKFSTSFSGSDDSAYEKVSVSSGTYVNDSSTKMTLSYSSDSSYYYQFSVDGSTLLLEDGTLLTESINEDKDTGITSAIGSILSGDFSLLDATAMGALGLVTASDFLKIGTLFDNDFIDNLSTSLTNSLLNGSTISLLDGTTFDPSLVDSISVTTGDKIYNEILTDLSNNTTNSTLWNQIDSSTKNNIQQSYNNLKTCMDNSLTVYKDNSSGDYYYQPSSTVSNNSSYPNYSTYVSEGGDSTTYYQTYIYNYSSDDDTDVTVAPTGGGSSSSGGGGNAYAYATAIAEGGNAEINQGDIVINVPSSSGGGSSGSGDDGDNDSDTSSDDSSIDDIDMSSFESLLDSTQGFWDLLKNMFTVFPDVVWTCLAGAISVVVVCRILGR